MWSQKPGKGLKDWHRIVCRDAPQRAQEAVSFAKDRSFEREAVTDEAGTSCGTP